MIYFERRDGDRCPDIYDVSWGAAGETYHQLPNLSVK
jgi:hypothetical protein